jgi:hypothetical protein
LGISFSQDGEVQLQNRGQYLNWPYYGQWKPLNYWMKQHEEMLFDLLQDKYILFGEWCYAKHSIYYSKLPSWFIAFDVYDIENEKFLSVRNRNKFLSNVSIAVINPVARGQFSFNELQAMQFKSFYGDDLAEGLYLRIDDDTFLKARAKLVRADFIQSIEDHWSNRSIIANRLSHLI